MKGKKAVIENIQVLIAPLVAIAIVLAVGFLIMSEMKTVVENTYQSNWCDSLFVYNSTDGYCHNETDSTTYEPGYSAAWNATSETQGALEDVPGWLPIIVVAIIGGILLGLVAFFRSR